MNEHIIQFLEGLVHGPCAGVDIYKYEQWVSARAAILLAELNGQEPDRAFERQEVAPVAYNPHYDGVFQGDK